MGAITLQSLGLWGGTLVYVGGNRPYFCIDGFMAVAYSVKVRQIRSAPFAIGALIWVDFCVLQVSVLWLVGDVLTLTTAMMNM